MNSMTQHLETARAARLGEKPDAEEMARLQRQSEQTARDLLATEGYFSPRVESTVERAGDDWRVVCRVDPGVRAPPSFSGGFVHEIWHAKRQHERPKVKGTGSRTRRILLKNTLNSLQRSSTGAAFNGQPFVEVQFHGIFSLPCGWPCATP